MTYKTILVHVDQSRHAETRIRMAAQLAAGCGAHLIGSAMTGVSRFMPPETLEMAGSAVAHFLELMNADAVAALARFSAIVDQCGVASYETRRVNDDVDGGLALQARYADLAIVSQFDPGGQGMASWSDLPEYLFMNSARPVLVLPYSSTATSLGRHAMVGWDGSLEATRALTQAMPLLRASQRVTVLVLNAARGGDHGPQPGADIALYLSRHGVKVEVLDKDSNRDVGAALLSQAARLQADLLVMGAYGHARFREMLLGGATRSVLESMTVPVLFAH